MLKAKPLEQDRNEKLASALEEVTKEPVVRLNVNVPQSLYRKMKVKAATDGVHLSDLVNKWAREYVSKCADE